MKSFTDFNVALEEGMYDIDPKTGESPVATAVNKANKMSGDKRLKSLSKLAKKMVGEEALEEKKGEKNCGCGQDPCITYGDHRHKDEKKVEEATLATARKNIGMDPKKPSCWKGYKATTTKMKDGKSVPNCKKEEVELEAEGTKYGLYKGSGKAGGAMKDFLDKKAKKLEAEKKKQKPEYRNNPAFGDPSHHSNKKTRTEAVKAKRWWDDDGDGKGYEKGEVDGSFKKGKKKVKEHHEKDPNGNTIPHKLEEKKAAKDYDGDGKVESGKAEYFGSKDKAIKKAMGKKVKHDCSSKVKHEQYGLGECIKEMHTLDENGNITHYDVLFAGRNLLRNVPVQELEVLVSEMHEHVINDEKNKEVIEASMKQARKNVAASTRWDGYKAKGTKKKGGKDVPNCVKEEDIEEGKDGLWDNIRQKKARMKSGSGEKKAKPGDKDYPKTLNVEASYTGPDKKDRKQINKLDNKDYAAKLADYEKNMDPKKRQALKDKATKGMKFTHEEKGEVYWSSKALDQLDAINEKDTALDIVKKKIIAQYGKGAIMRKGSNQAKKVKGAKSTAGTNKYKDMADKKKETAADAKKRGFKSTQNYVDTMARYGGKDNYDKGKGLGT